MIYEIRWRRRRFKAKLKIFTEHRIFFFGRIESRRDTGKWVVRTGVENS